MSRPPIEQLVNVRRAAHGRGGTTLFISGRGARTRTLWIADDELAEVIKKLSTVQIRQADAPGTG